jgi:hypothetical protein
MTMKRISVMLGFIFTLAVGAFLWPTLGSQAQAQSGCKSFEAIGQASLPSSTPLGVTFDVWGGPLYVMLEGQHLPGLTVFSGNDGLDTWRRHIGQGRGGLYTVGANCIAPASPALGYTCADTFSYEVPNSVFPSPPGQAGLVHYIGNTAKILGGTGRFTGASGNLNVRGPAIAWPDDNPFGASGRWNPEISGKICGIQ